MTEASVQPTIVVGIDGSAASRSALAWAVDEARKHGWAVTALHVWQFPGLTLGDFGGATLPALAPEDIEKIAEETATTTVAEVVGTDLSVPVTVWVRRGHPAAELVNASKTAAQVVVGSEGHGAFTGMLLGSVSMHVVHHARCPVTVVRPGWSSPN